MCLTPLGNQILIYMKKIIIFFSEYSVIFLYTPLSNHNNTFYTILGESDVGSSGIHKKQHDG